jgi:hypothetical protein
MDRADDTKMRCWSSKQVDEYQIENHWRAGDGFGLRQKLLTNARKDQNPYIFGYGFALPPLPMVTYILNVEE